METTPLLPNRVMVDPPIDDESFRNETHPFPSEEQKHLTFAGYTTTSMLTRFFEIMSIFLIVEYYDKSLRPVTIFSLLILSASIHLDTVFKYVSSKFSSRLVLTCLLIFVQRFVVVLFSLVWIYSRDAIQSRLGECIKFLVLTGCVVYLKCSFIFYQTIFRTDWLQILTCSHQSLRVQFERIMSLSFIFSHLVLSVFVGYMIQFYDANVCCKLVIFVSVIGFLVETSMVYKLYHTCYALYLPRDQRNQNLSKSDIFEYNPVLGVITTHFTALSVRHQTISVSRPSLSLMMSYIKVKPLPLAVTIGTSLVNVSLVTVGPHMVWFFLRKDMSPPLIGVYKFLQAVTSMKPLFTDKRAILLFIFGNLAALSLLFLSNNWTGTAWVHLLALAVIVAKSGVAGINRVSDQFVGTYLADEELHSVYDENVVWFRTRLELAVHILPLVWPYENQFFVPLFITAATSIVGILITFYVLLKHHR